MRQLLDAALRALGSLSSLGVVGRATYVIGLTIYTALCLPTTPVELAAGFVFPLREATTMSLLGKTFGNLLALLVGRWLLKPLVFNVLVRSVGNRVYQHVVSEMHQRPIQTMSILRAAPLPTPFKIYGLSILPAQLVPMRTYAVIAVVFNSCWSLIWALAGSSAQDAKHLGDSQKHAGLAVKLFFFVGLFGVLLQFARFAKAQLEPPESSSSELCVPSESLLEPSDSRETPVGRGGTAKRRFAKPAKAASTPPAVAAKDKKQMPRSAENRSRAPGTTPSSRKARSPSPASRSRGARSRS